MKYLLLFVLLTACVDVDAIKQEIADACRGRVCPDKMKPVGVRHYAQLQPVCECHAGDAP